MDIGDTVKLKTNDSFNGTTGKLVLRDYRPHPHKPAETTYWVETVCPSDNRPGLYIFQEGEVEAVQA